MLEDVQRRLWYRQRHIIPKRRELLDARQLVDILPSDDVTYVPIKQGAYFIRPMLQVTKHEPSRIQNIEPRIRLHIPTFPIPRTRTTIPVL